MTQKASTRKFRVLLVEDSVGDAHLFKRIFLEEDKDLFHLVVFHNSEDARRYLTKAGKYAGEETPDLIVLDWKLPRVRGSEMLNFIRSDPNLGAIPVVVFSNSASPKDIDEAYRNGSSGYFLKPVSIAEFRSVLSSIKRYWFSTVRLPTNPDD